MAKDYAEILLQSIDEVVSRRIEAVKFDTTDVATIIEVKDAEQGKYLVSTGSMEYVAYSTSTSYKRGDSVYVTIPNGDYDKQKIIIGKYVSDQTEPFVYNSPFSTLVDTSGNLITDTIKAEGLVANYMYDLMHTEENYGKDDTISQEAYTAAMAQLRSEMDNIENGMIYRKIWERNFSQETLVGYTRVGIQGQFRSWLNQWKTKDGNYGLRLDVSYTTPDSDYNIECYNQVLQVLNQIEALSVNLLVNLDEIKRKWQWILNSSVLQLTEEERRVSEPSAGLITTLRKRVNDILNQINGTRSLFFDCSQFYGNPYNFNSYYQQEAVFDISFLGDTAQITEMVLYFYQVPDTFFGADGNPLPYKDNLGNGIAPNLFVKDPYVCVGYSIGEFNDDNLTLYTTSSLTYRRKEGDDYTENEWERKTLQLRWLHKFSDGLIKQVAADSELNYEVRWYRYAAGAPSPDSYAGVGWKQITVYKKNAYGQEVVNSRAFEYRLESETRLDETKPSEAFKCIIILSEMSMDGKLINTETFRSNILEFRNEESVVDTKTLEKASGLSIECADNSNGNYFLYGQSSKIQESAESKNIRQLLLYFREGDSNTSKLVQQAVRITWRFPASNSMIELSDPYNPNEMFNVLKNAKNNRALNREGSSFSLDNDSAWSLAPSFKVIEFGKAAQEFVSTYNGNGEIVKGPTNGGFTYDILWSGICYDELTDEYVISYKGDPAFAYLNNPSLCYKIKGTYSQSYSNNTVTCSMERGGEVYTAYTTLRFGPSGTNGSAYTLIVDFNNVEQSTSNNLVTSSPAENYILTQGVSESIVVTATLFDTDHRPMTNYSGTYEWSWADGTYNKDTRFVNVETELVTIVQNQFSVSNNQIKLVHDQETGNGYSQLLDGLLYLQCTLKGFGNYDLTTVVPIAIRKQTGQPDTEYVRTEGPEKVTYPSSGYPDFYRIPFEIQKRTKDGGGWEQLPDTPGDRVKWVVYNPNQVLANWLPSNDNGRLPSDSLQPAGIYIKDGGQYGVRCIFDDEVIWTQPIYCCQNEYPSGTINKWDGKGIEIDENEGTILAPAVAAGKKNIDNTFSGVMLGDWSGKTDIANDISQQTGIYGFNHGAMSYAFKEDGTAFLGQSGMGRILFDGTKATIQSESYQQNSGGMYIDLDDGLIEIQGNVKLTDESIIGLLEHADEDLLDEEYEPNKYYYYNRNTHKYELDSSPELVFGRQYLVLKDQNSTYGTGKKVSQNTYEKSGSKVRISSASPYFTIKTEDYDAEKHIYSLGNEIIHIGTDGYFLQSDDWHEDGNNGLYVEVEPQDKVNGDNYRQYFIQNGFIYSRADGQVFNPDLDYYEKLGDNLYSENPIVLYEYTPNTFYTHFVIDGGEYKSDREYYNLGVNSGTFTQITDFYVNTYQPDKYYYRKGLDKIIATGQAYATYNPALTYYERIGTNEFRVVPDSEIIDTSLYTPNRYYYRNMQGSWEVDVAEFPTPYREYYMRVLLQAKYKAIVGIKEYKTTDGLYVISDTNQNLAYGSYDPNQDYYIQNSETGAMIKVPVKSFEDFITVVYENDAMAENQHTPSRIGYNFSIENPIQFYYFDGQELLVQYSSEVDDHYELQPNRMYYIGIQTAIDRENPVQSDEIVLFPYGYLYKAADDYSGNGIAGQYYTSTDVSYVEVAPDHTYDPTENITYYRFNGVNYEKVKPSEFEITPQWFIDKQLNRELYIIAGYMQTDYEWRSDLEFYYESNVNEYTLIRTEAEFNATNIHYLRNYTLNTENYSADTTYYERDYDAIQAVGNDAFDYISVGELYINNYRQGKYWVDGSGEEGYLEIIPLTKRQFTTEIDKIINQNLASEYFIKEIVGSEQINIYALDTNGNQVKVYYNSYAPNTYYYYDNTLVNLFPGLQYNDQYTYYTYRNSFLTECKFYKPRTYYTREPNYITPNSYSSSETYYELINLRGTRIDVQRGEIRSYNLKLEGRRLDNETGRMQHVVVTSQEDQPIKVGYVDNNGNLIENFFVNWDGYLSSTYGKIGGWNIEADRIYSDTVNGDNGQNTINSTDYSHPYIQLNSDGTIFANYNPDQTGWLITGAGNAYFMSGRIGKWDLTPEYLKYGDTLGSNGTIALYPAGTTDEVIIADSESMNDWTILSGSNFGVTKDGDLYSGSGHIGGWIISAGALNSGNTYLYSIDQSDPSVVNSHSANDWRLRVASNFGVDASGNLYASGADIKGNIHVDRLWIKNQNTNIFEEIVAQKVKIPVAFRVEVGYWYEWIENQGSYTRTIKQWLTSNQNINESISTTLQYSHYSYLGGVLLYAGLFYETALRAPEGYWYLYVPSSTSTAHNPWGVPGLWEQTPIVTVHLDEFIGDYQNVGDETITMSYPYYTTAQHEYYEAYISQIAECQVFIPKGINGIAATIEPVSISLKPGVSNDYGLVFDYADNTWKATKEVTLFLTDNGITYPNTHITGPVQLYS